MRKTQATEMKTILYLNSLVMFQTKKMLTVKYIQSQNIYIYICKILIIKKGIIKKEKYILIYLREVYNKCNLQMIQENM